MFSAPLLRLAEMVLMQAREKKLRIATAESCTGGLIAGLLTEIPGSSDVVERGFVVYSNRAKSDLLGRAGRSHRRYGRGVGSGRARHGRRRCREFQRAHGGCRNGVAGPGGGTPLKPVGLVHIAAAREGPFDPA